MEPLSLGRRLVIIVVFILGSFVFDSVMKSFFGEGLFPILIVLTGTGTGLIVSQIEAWLVKNRPSWFVRPIFRLGQAMFLSTVGLSLSFALVIGITNGFVCYTNPSHFCGGPPLFLQIIIMSTTFLLPALFVGAIIGFAYHFILPSTGQELSLLDGNRRDSGFTLSDRVGGIALFGMLVAVSLLLTNHTFLGFVLLIFCILLLISALIFKKRNSK